MNKFDKLYQTIIEKVTKHKQALYITSPILNTKDSNVYDLYKKFPKNEMVEPELNPHMTLFYSPNAEGYNQTEVLEYLKDKLQDKEFSANLAKFHVFENVGDDEDQDCLDIKIEVSDELKELQKEIVKYLKKNVNTLQIDYPKWQPHMTIGYYEHGKIPDYGEIDPIGIVVKDFFCKFGDSSSKKYNL